MQRGPVPRAWPRFRNPRKIPSPRPVCSLANTGRVGQDPRLTLHCTRPARAQPLGARDTPTTGATPGEARSVDASSGIDWQDCRSHSVPDGRGGRAEATGGGDGATQPAVAVATRTRAGHVFAGPGPMQPGGLAAQARAHGCIMEEWDIKQGGAAHDLLRAPPWRLLLERCEESYDYAHWGIPCTTFTVILALQRRVLRKRSCPSGRGGLTGKDADDVREANDLIRKSVRGMRAIVDRGGEVTFENVTDRGDPAIAQCYWDERRSMVALSLMPEVAAFIDYAQITQIHIPMCSMEDEPWDGASPLPPVKWVTFYATPGAARILSPLNPACGRRCPHGRAAHAPAIGRDGGGQSLAAFTAAYARAMNSWLALVAAAFAGDGRRDGPAAPPGAQIGCGPVLHTEMLAQIQRARHQPARFADFRKAAAMPVPDRRHAPYPTPLCVDAEYDADPPDASWSITLDGEDDERKESFAPGMLRPLRSHHGIPGLPPGRVTYRMIWRRMPSADGRRLGYEAIVQWVEAAFAAAPDLLAGRQHSGPGTLEIPDEWKEEWACLVLLDTRDPTDVVRMRRSTRHTVFPGARQMNRARFRDLISEMDWRRVDPDIADQAGEGGIESRSHCPRRSLFTWCHRGMREHFAAAHDVALAEYDDSWLIGPYPMPPSEPCRCIPNNVLMQQRPYVNAQRELIQRLKARVTTNESFGDAISPNAGVRHADKTTHLPSHQSHAAGAAITDAIFAPSGWRAGQYATDLTGAFSFLVHQRDEWWMQVRFMILAWCDTVVAGAVPARRTSAAATRTRTGFFFQPRTIFGGTWGPNRFMRVQRPKAERVRRRQAAFDEANPYPPEVYAILRERAALQAGGLLPPGAEQLSPSALQVFIDDETGSAGSDTVVMPAELAHIDVAAIISNTLLAGGRPSAPTSRTMVHCCISIDESTRLHLELAESKMQCGDGVVVLGLRADVEADCSNCPDAKAQVMIAELRSMLYSMADESTIERSIIERNVGRLCNISQIEPALLLHMHAGYALSHAHSRGGHGQPRRRLRHIRINSDRPIGRQFSELLVTAINTLTANVGVPLLHEASFPAHGSPRTLTVVTDASGEDGVGGYAFHPSHADTVFVVHGPWSRSVREAMAYSARRTAAKAASAPEPSCSMPSAEVFGTWGVVETVSRHGVGFDSVIAVTDCKPAASIITAARSKSRVMRHLVHAMRDTAAAWLGAHILRQWNSDADLLSHPDSVHLVIQAARDAGLTVVELPMHSECWGCLDMAIASAFAESA